MSPRAVPGSCATTAASSRVRRWVIWPGQDSLDEDNRSRGASTGRSCDVLRHRRSDRFEL